MARPWCRVVALSLALVPAGAGWLALAQDAPAAPLPAPPTAGATDDAQALLAYEQNTVAVMRRLGPSVVTVGVEVQGRRLGPFEGLPEDQIPLPYRNLPPQLRQGTGSGFVIDDSMRVLTNLHVVELALADGSVDLREGAHISLRFPGVDKDFPARVVGANALYDLALLEPETLDTLPPVVRERPALAFADSDAVVPGQKAIAIGNPFGFENTVTVGTVSGLARHLLDVGEADLPFIQTDAAINPGNSGGPLLNSRGQVIGINTAILPGGGGAGGQRGFIGLGFAIPSNLARGQLPGLLAGGLTNIASSARLGISGIGLDDYPDAVKQQLGLPDAGVMVVTVEPGSGAAEADLRPATDQTSVGGQLYPSGGDVITAVDGQPVVTAGDLQRAILGRLAGDEVRLELLRDGARLEATVTLRRVP